jgi:hypothetical protein
LRAWWSSTAPGTAPARSDAGRAQFGDGQCAGAANHQVGPAVGRRHVGDERFDVRGYAGFGVGRRVSSSIFRPH